MGKVQPPRDLPISSGLGRWRPRAPGCSGLELGRIVQPNLSFRVTLGPPENHGRATGGEGCSGRWHGLDRSPEMPLSSLVVEESLRTARILRYLRSRKLRCESQVCTPERFWCLFGKIWERATAAEDREGQHQSCGWGRRCSRWHLVSLWHPIPPSSCQQRLAAPVYPFTPKSSPFGGVSAQRKPSHDPRSDPITLPLPAQP